MKKYHLSLILLSLFIVITNLNGQVSETENEITAFINVTVVPMDSFQILENQTVLIDGGIIKDIGSAESITIPKDAVIINGRGRYLMPGLTDFHVHLLSSGEWLSYLAYGVTTIVNMSGTTSSAPDPLTARGQINNGELLAPTLYTTGPSIDGNPPNFAPVSDVAATPEKGRKIVNEQLKMGYDFIKVYNGIAPDVLTEIVKTAHEKNTAVFGHIPRNGGRAEALQRVLSAGMDMITHGEEYFFTYFYEGVDSLLNEGKIPYRNENKIAGAVKLTKEAGTVVTPNLSFIAMTRRLIDDFEGVIAEPEFQYLHPNVQGIWKDSNPINRSDIEKFDMREKAKYDLVKKLTRQLHENGVTLLLGTDSPLPGLFPGSSAHLELKELVDAGLSPFEALETGTINAGNFIKENLPSIDSFGTITPNKRADLILLSKNPLDDIQNIYTIEGVMVGGRWFIIEDLQKLREE